MNENSNVSYLKALGVPEAVASKWISMKEEIISTSNGLYALPSEYADKIQELESTVCRNYEIYHVMATYAYGCEVISYLLRPLNPDENETILNSVKNGCCLAYCLNTSVPEFNEAGFIDVKYIPETQTLVRYDI